jgi:hypothetical protein
MGADVTRAQVVEFWRTVEMFSPQKVDPPEYIRHRGSSVIHRRERACRMVP